MGCTCSLAWPGTAAWVDSSCARRHRETGLSQEFGVLSLDVEGVEFAVLQGILDEGYRPRYVLVEVRERLPELDELLGARGYVRLAWFHSDGIYWRERR